MFLESFQIDPAVLVLGGREDRELLRFIREGAVELLVMGAYGNNRLRGHPKEPNPGSPHPLNGP